MCSDTHARYRHAIMSRRNAAILAVIESTEIHWLRVAGNRTAEHWVNFDQLGILRQLGPRQ